VPFGDISLDDLSSITLRLLEEPRLPSEPDASIVADLRADLPPEWERMLATAALRGVPVYHFKLLQESIAGKVKIEHLSENTLGSLVPDQSYKEVKWVVDRLGAAILIPLLAPLLVAVALVIKLQDGGSVFYNQRRVGLGGKPFTIYKFRSMSPGPEPREDSDNARESSITLENDPRITRFGRFIRKYRIDELPQIFNILKGEMSFIGPRPEAIPLAEWYDKELPFYSYRHIVLPGLTGWAQVNQGHVADLCSIDYKLQYDFYYVKYFSMWLDVLIVLRTIRTILTGFGSK
jgi:lipopolysaccharide/colanic/teichoic acid biosynthesis glycosyltransferase